MKSLKLNHFSIFTLSICAVVTIRQCWTLINGPLIPAGKHGCFTSLSPPHLPPTAPFPVFRSITTMHVLDSRTVTKTLRCQQKQGAACAHTTLLSLSLSLIYVLSRPSEGI